MITFPAGFHEHFWSHPKTSSTGCYLWPKVYAGKRGYGSVFVNGKRYAAHRIAWMLVNGDIPDGLLVCHRCDIRNCVNPYHLFLGTDADNSRDRDKKGRAAPHDGENNGRHKLTAAMVVALRQARIDGASFRELGLRFGVTNVTARNAVVGATWKAVA